MRVGRWLGCALLLALLGPAAPRADADEKHAVRLFRPIPKAHYTYSRINQLRGRATLDRGERLEWQRFDERAMLSVQGRQRFRLQIETPSGRLEILEMILGCRCVPKALIYRGRLRDGTVALLTIAWEDTPSGRRRYRVHALVLQDGQTLEYRPTTLPYQEGTLYLQRRMPVLIPLLPPGRHPRHRGPLRIPDYLRRMNRDTQTTTEEEPEKDDGSKIELIAGYTNDVDLAQDGDILGLRATLGTAVCYFNEALERSQVDTQICLVDLVPVDLWENGADGPTLLADVQGNMDFRAKRYDLKADVATVIVASTGVGNFGHAELWLDDDEDFAEHAYSVTALNFLGSQHSLAHEVSHNFGCQHAEGATAVQMIAEHARGHTFTAPAWVPTGNGDILLLGYDRLYATIQGTVGTDAIDWSAVALVAFSTPDVKEPEGTADGDALGVADYADNARVIRDRLGVIANWGNNLAPVP